MKKLISVLLILALLLPLAALADDFYIARHYSLHINAHTGKTTSPKGGSMFDFDSVTMDLFLTSDGENGYMIETTCTSGIFFSSGIYQVRLVTVGGNSFIVDNNGNNYAVTFDENGTDLWLNTSRGLFRFRLVEYMDPFTDWK